MSKPTPSMVKNTCGFALQQGSALIIALVFLLVMTLIGTTAMQGTSQQEGMAGNLRNRNLAFQAAEAALRIAELRVDPAVSPTLPTFDNTGANVGLGATLASITDWNTQTQLAYATAILNEIFAQPRYIIENLGWVTISDPASAGYSARADAPPPGNNFYRITARGLGGTADAVAILQTTYRR